MGWKFKDGNMKACVNVFIWIIEKGILCLILFSISRAVHKDFWDQVPDGGAKMQPLLSFR